MIEPVYGVDEDLEKLMERADVNAAQRLTFRSCPDRAKALLLYALARPKIRNPAAFALTRIRAEQDAPRAPEPTPADPLTVDELERSLTFAREHGAPAIAVEQIERELDAARAVEALHSAA